MTKKARCCRSGGPVKRALEGQAVVDTSWAMALRPDGTFDRIYLFGFSRGAYTARCVGGVLKACGVPTAVRQPGGRVRPLRRDARSARRVATEAVKHVYQYGGSIKGDPYRNERAKRAARFRHKYFSGDASVSNTAPYFIGAWDTSLRQAPNATAATTAARTIAPFIAVSLRLHVEGS